MDASTLGQWIASRRAQRGWSQMDLAVHLKTGTSSVSRWERGLDEPRCAVLRRICEVFDCSADEALGLPTRKAS